MHPHQLVVLLCTALLSTAFPYPMSGSKHVSRGHSFISAAKANVKFKIYDFLISDVVANETYNSTAAAWNTSFSFLFTDPNSNTSTTCSSTWLENSTLDNIPYGPSYTLCNATAVADEFFEWHMNTYSSPENFSIEVAHYFSDPVHYPPPFNYVEYFSRAININLSSDEAAGVTGFYLPPYLSPISAPVNSISN